MVKLGITVDRGVIDSDYREEIKMIIINRHKTVAAKLFSGDKIAQMIIIPIWAGTTTEVDELEETERGTQGFRSTDVYIVKNITELKHNIRLQDKYTYQIGKAASTEQKEKLKKFVMVPILSVSVS